MMSHVEQRPVREGPVHYDHPQQFSSSHHAEENSEEQHRSYASHEEEVASFLLSLKHNHRSITPEPMQQLPLSHDFNKVTASPSRYDYPSHHQDVSPIPTHHYSDDGMATQTFEYQGNVPVEQLVHSSNSMLVSLQDADLVPDALFIAMAQMKPTHLTMVDRVGCYKNRPIGYLGMCCKHCGGQPGFGRYFPNSVRSLAQTTTSQTILKHIGSKCRFCPPAIRAAVVQLQRSTEVRDITMTLQGGRPRYGSRKVFFQRVWDRLHRLEQYHDDGDRYDAVTAAPPSTTGSHDDASSSNQTPSDTDEDRSLEAWSADGDDSEKKARHDMD